MEQDKLIVEPKITKYLFRKASQIKVPLSGTFELTPMCNFSCKMCYVRKTADEVRKSPRRMLTKEEWLDIAKAAKENGMLYLLLTGGEPLLWPDFWGLYEELINMGFLISINTNGSMIDDVAIARFKALPPLRINITLYGASDETYEALCGRRNVFAKVDYAISELQKAHISVKLNGSLTPHNVCDLEKCIVYAQNHGLIYEPVSYMFPPLRRDESLIGQNERFTPEEAAVYSLKAYRLQYGEVYYHRFLQSIANGIIPPPGLDENCIDPLDGKIRCRAGKASFWITWDGYMTPCGMMPGPKIDIQESDFGAAWATLIEVSEMIRLSGTCEKCSNKNLCHSCAAMALAETGSTEGIPQYLCEKVLATKKIAMEELQKL